MKQYLYTVMAATSPNTKYQMHRKYSSQHKVKIKVFVKFLKTFHSGNNSTVLYFKSFYLLKKS